MATIRFVATQVLSSEDGVRGYYVVSISIDVIDRSMERALGFLPVWRSLQ